MRIAIVGGSIAGCTAASVLLGDGHEVCVFEREPEVARGAGIGLMPDTFEVLADRGLVSRSLPRIPIERYVFAGRDAEESPLGHIALELSQPSFALHWAELYRELRARVPASAYRGGCEVVAVQQSETCATLELADRTRADFDLVLFADGYRSRGRQLVCPESPLEYRGYTLWRGLLPESRLTDVAPLYRSVFRVSHANLPGQTVAYSIPGPDGSQLVNWASYLPLSAAELPGFLIDREGRARSGSLPPGSMRPAEEARLRALLRSELPAYFAQLVEFGQETFAQPIYSVAPARFHRGRLALLGDAGALAQPLTGSGVFKAVTNVFSLASQLRKTSDLAQALAAWDARAVVAGRALVQLGAHMEQHLIWSNMKFGSLSQNEARAFWEMVTRLPG